MNNAVGVQISLLYSSFNYLRYIQRSGNAGSYGSLIFNFLMTSILFSIVIAPFNNSTKVLVYTQSDQHLSFSGFWGFFDPNNPNGCKVMSHCGFDLYFFTK